jgi:hypothetical protein
MRFPELRLIGYGGGPAGSPLFVLALHGSASIVGIDGAVLVVFFNSERV